MPRRRFGNLGLVLATTVLAGCTGGHGAPSSGPPPPPPVAHVPHVPHARTLTFPSPQPAARQPWRITAAQATGIAGFVSRDSIAPGDPLTLYVSTTAQRFRLQVYRMGWYGGFLGRLTETLGPYAGRSQPRRRSKASAAW